MQTAGEAIGCAALLRVPSAEISDSLPGKSIKVVGTEMRTDKKMCEICRYSAHMQMFNVIVHLVFMFYHLACNNYFWFFVWFFG